MIESNPEALVRLRDFFESIDRTDPRVVARWTDEQHILPEGESGFTVRPVARVILTARVHGEVVRETFEEVALVDLKQIASDFPFKMLYRSDNIVR